MRQDVAETICGMMDDVLRSLHALTQYAIENSKDVPIQRIRHAIGTCVTELDLEILEPIYREYPHLKPKELP
jgi:hypothetical protein